MDEYEIRAIQDRGFQSDALPEHIGYLTLHGRLCGGEYFSAISYRLDGIVPQILACQHGTRNELSSSSYAPADERTSDAFQHVSSTL